MKTKRELLTRGARNVPYLVIFKVLSQLFNVSIQLIVIRALTRSDYGIYSLFHSTSGVLGIVASLGLENVLQRYTPEYYSQGKTGLVVGLLKVTLLLRLVTNVAILSVAVFTWDLFASYLGIQPYRHVFLVFCLVILMQRQLRLTQLILNSCLLQHFTFPLTCIVSLVRFVAYTYIFYNDGLLIEFFAVDAIAYSLLYVSLQIVFRQSVGRRENPAIPFSKSEKKRLFRYGAYCNFNDMGANLLDHRIDNYIIAVMLTHPAVAAYSFCNQVGQILKSLLPTTYLVDIIRPLFLGISTQSSVEDVRRYYLLMVKMVYSFYLPAFVYVAVLRNELVDALSGGKYNAYAVALVLVVLFHVLSAFETPLGMLAQLRERAGLMLVSKVFGVVNLALGLLLVYHWGIEGMIIATGFSTLAKNVFILWFTRKESSLLELCPFVLSGSVYWAVVGGVMALAWSASESSIGRIIVGLCLFTLAMVPFCRYFVFSEKEKRSILGTIGSTRVRYTMSVVLGA